jgi:hypothetical protein
MAKIMSRYHVSYLYFYPIMLVGLGHVNDCGWLRPVAVFALAYLMANSDSYLILRGNDDITYSCYY